MSDTLVLTNRSRKQLWIRLNNGDYATIPAGKTTKDIDKATLASETAVEKLCKWGLLSDDTPKSKGPSKSRRKSKKKNKTSAKKKSKSISRGEG